MAFLLPVKTGFGLLSLLLLAQLAKAQPIAETEKYSSTEYQIHDKYYEQITYIGKRKDHFIVNTYLKDSTLYRTDNYRYIAQGNLLDVFAVRHGPTKILYNDGKLYLTCDYNMNVLNGAFMVYYNDGSIKRRELYKNGNVKKSVCYDPDGVEQPCEPFYQQPRFMGNEKELKEYLLKSLPTVLEGSMMRGMAIKLIINDIGQIIEVVAETGLENPKVAAGVRRVIQEMPRWRENESNWKPALMDGIPVTSVWAIQVYRDRSFLQVSLPQPER